MITHGFIHASLYLDNKQNLPSLILEDIHGKSLLIRLMENIQNSTSFDRINIVTSDNPIDDEIVQCIEKLQHNELRVPIKVIRVAQSMPYAFTDDNRIMNDDFLYQKSYFGFYSPECLLQYTSQNQMDIAVIFTADDLPLIEPEFIDRTVHSFQKNGVRFSSALHNGSEIYVVPTYELSAKLTSCKYKHDSDLKSELEVMKESLSGLKSFNANLDLDLLEKEKSTCISKIYSRLHLDHILKGYNPDFGRIVGTAELYQFYPAHRQRDLEQIRNLYSKYASLYYSEYDKYIQSIEKNSNCKFPSLLEIELTNRCNLKCDDCPQTVLNRPSKDMDKEVFEKIVDKFSDFTPFFVLSGYGEPTLHPHIVDFIRYAKEKNVTRICLETNGTHLDKSFIQQLIDVKLDILLINIDAYDMFSCANTESLLPSERLINDIRSLKNERQVSYPFIALQTVNRKSTQSRVNYNFNRWQYIVDAVVIQPFNDYCNTFDKTELINMSPINQSHLCKKTMNNLAVLSDGNATLCKQKFDGFQPSENKDYLGFWADNYLRGGKIDFCADCEQKFFDDISIADKIDHFLKYKLTNKLHTSLLKKQLDEGLQLFDQKMYSEALQVWGKVLKYDPDNEMIIERLASFS